MYLTLSSGTYLKLWVQKGSIGKYEWTSLYTHRVEKNVPNYNYDA